MAKIKRAADNHLRAFRGVTNREGHFDQILQASFDYHLTRRQLDYVPDRGEEIKLGSTWLKATANFDDAMDEMFEESKTQRATTFVARTFLYIGFQEVSGMVFVPDSARAPLVTSIVTAEHDLRDS